VTAPGPVAILIATQNLNAVLRIMQWGVIALIFLFFLRVIRAVWVEMSPATIRKPRSMRRQERREERAAVGAAAGAAEPARASRKRQLYLKVVQPPEHAGRTYDLDDELTIGRSPGCGVAMPEDIYTSTLHARLFRRNDQLWVEDLGSTNGTFVNSERITQAVRLGKGDLLQIGSTVFEVSR
jgi:FHA domain